MRYGKFVHKSEQDFVTFGLQMATKDAREEALSEIMEHVWSFEGSRTIWIVDVAIDPPDGRFKGYWCNRERHSAASGTDAQNKDTHSTHLRSAETV